MRERFPFKHLRTSAQHQHSRTHSESLSADVATSQCPTPRWIFLKSICEHSLDVLQRGSHQDSPTSSRVTDPTNNHWRSNSFGKWTAVVILPNQIKPLSLAFNGLSRQKSWQFFICRGDHLQSQCHPSSELSECNQGKILDFIMLMQRIPSYGRTKVRELPNQLPTRPSGVLYPARINSECI
jgi:hypothetical protein